VAVLHLTVLHPTQNAKLFIVEIPTFAVKKAGYKLQSCSFYMNVFIITLIDLARLYKVNGSCKAVMIAIHSHSIISVAPAPRRAAPRHCRYVAI